MTWLAVLEVLVRLFGPVLVEWLRKLLDDAAREMPGVPSHRPVEFDGQLGELFRRARGKTGWFAFRKRAALRIAERAARNRGGEIAVKAMHPNIAQATVKPLTIGERIELRAALA